VKGVVKSHAGLHRTRDINRAERTKIPCVPRKMGAAEDEGLTRRKDRVALKILITRGLFHFGDPTGKMAVHKQGRH